MKITKSQLKKIIKEELTRVLFEQEDLPADMEEPEEVKIEPLPGEDTTPVDMSRPEPEIEVPEVEVPEFEEITHDDAMADAGEVLGGLANIVNVELSAWESDWNKPDVIGDANVNYLIKLNLVPDEEGNYTFETSSTGGSGERSELTEFVNAQFTESLKDPKFRHTLKQLGKKWGSISLPINFSRPQYQQRSAVEF